MARVDITPNGSNWKAVKNGRTVGTATTQQAMINEVRNMESKGTNVVVHGRDGRVRDSFTIGG